MCCGVLDAFYIFDRVAECIHINLWRFCRRTASAGATAAATFGVAAAVLLLIFKRVQVGCPRAKVRTDRDCNNCDENGGDGDQPHPARGAEGNECAKEEETPARIQTGPATTCEPSQASFDLRTSGIRRPKYLFPGSRRAVAKPPKTSQYTAKINMIIPTATMTVILIPDRRKYPNSNCRKGSGVG